MLYFTRNQLLSSTCVQHAKTFAQMFLSVYLTCNQRKTFAKQLQNVLEVVTCKIKH